MIKLEGIKNEKGTFLNVKYETKMQLKLIGTATMASYMKPEGKSSIEAATEAIAKVNAMLIAKGKLKPSQVNSTLGGKKASGSQNNLITTEVDINDVPIGCRNMLTRGITQEEISKMSGAAVATRGRFMTAEERARHPSDRALYLSIQATTQQAVDLAVGRINEIIANGIARQGAKTSRFSPANPVPPRVTMPQGPRPSMNAVPPPAQHVLPQANQNVAVLQEKLYIGLEHAPPNFSVKDKVLGPGATFLQHVQAETGGKVSLRGKGSGFIEPHGAEAHEPMHVHIQHVHMMGLQQAKELATNLIQTVQQEYAAFQQSFVTMPPPNALPQHPLMIPPPQMVSLAQPPPLLPGQQVVSLPMSSMAPPMSLLQPPPQTTMLPPPPGPGQVMQQPQTIQTFAAPSSMGQPMQQAVQQTIQQPIQQPIQQYVQSSENQIIAGGQASQQQILVSMAPGQQPGQMVLSSMAGQPLAQPQQVTQMQQSLGPPGTIQIQPQQLGQPQPQQAGLQQQQQALAQPQQLQPGTALPQVSLQQQAGIQQPQQITIQQQPQQQQLQQQQQQGIIQQAGLPTSQTQLIQQVPPGTPGLQQVTAVSMQPLQQHSPQPQPQPGIQVQAMQQPQQPQVVSVPQQVQTLAQQTFVQAGGVPAGVAPASAVSWGSPAPTSYAPVAASAQAFSMSVVQPIQSNGTVIMSSPQTQPVVSSLSTSPIPATASGGYVYNPGPREEPKRRFTEVKQEDKLPENLLGYEHGPPHLANLVVQPGQPQQQAPPTQAPPQQQAPPPATAEGTTVLQAQVDPNLPPGAQGAGFEGQVTTSFGGQVLIQQQPQQQQQQVGIQSVTVTSVQQLQQQAQEQQRSEGEERYSAPNLVQSPGPQQVFSQANGDKMLMPPPPPPSGVKRQAGSPQGTQEPRKKGKGFNEDEDDDVDIPSSMASQVKEFKKYSYNQYSSTPQLYMNQDNPGQNFDNPNQGFEQMGAPQAQQPPPGSPFDQFGMGSQSPIPGNQSPGPVPTDQVSMGYQRDSASPSTQYQQPGQFQPDMQTRQTNVYLGSMSQPPPPPQQPIYAPTSMAPPFMQYTAPPPPPLMEDPRTPNQDDGSQKDRGDGRGYNPKFMPYNREDKNPLHQPPPPPPPRSYW